MKTMREKLRRVRRRRLMLRPSERDGKKPVRHHDLLMVPPLRDDPETGKPPGVLQNDELFRIPVIKNDQVNQGQNEEGPLEAEDKGKYLDPPELLDSYDYAQRKVLSASRPQDHGPAQLRQMARGIAFGTLPVKVEPAATSCGTCYLINAQNMRFGNAWTAEEWNTPDTLDLPADDTAAAPTFDALIAGPRGKVFYLNVNLVDANGVDLWPAGSTGWQDTRGSLQSVDLRHETEIWRQLRNGAVAARVHFRGRQGPPGRPQGPTPLVNITTLVADSDLPVRDGDGALKTNPTIQEHRYRHV